MIISEPGQYGLVLFLYLKKITTMTFNHKKRIHWILALTSLFLLNSCQAQKKSKMNSISAKEIIGLINSQKPVHIQNRTIQDDLDFTTISNADQVNESLDQYIINSGIHFSNCRFLGKIIFFKQEKNKMISGKINATLSFVNCGFDAEFMAKSLDISGMLSLPSCTFSKVANFEDINANHDVNFSKSIFNEEARFQNAAFQRRLNMLGCEFTKVASFQGSSFRGDAQLSNIKFLEYCAFGLCQFHENVFFNYSIFQKKAIFNQCVFNNRAEWNDTKMYHVEFKNTQFRGMASFVNTAISGKAIWDRVTFFMQAIPLDQCTIQKENLTVNEVVTLYKN